MYLEGDHSVLRRIVAKRENPDDESIRPALLVLHGLMRGVYGGGVVCALEELGARRVFDAVVGVSTGAPTVAYFLSGQAHLGTTIYHEECTTRDFISVRRALMQQGPLVDVDYLTDVFRGKIGEKQLSAEQALQNGKLAFIATDRRTAEPVFLEPANPPDVCDGIHASITMPVVYDGSSDASGRELVDGGISSPFPTEGVVARYKPTDLLVVMNRPRDDKPKWSRRWLLPKLMYNETSELREAMAFREERFWLDYKRFVSTESIPYVLLWSDNTIDSLTRDPVVLKSASERTRQWVHEQFELAARFP